MLFEHYDTGNSYEIPKELYDYDLFSIEDNVLVLCTGEREAFDNRENAEAALCFIDEAIRWGGTSLFVEENPYLSYGVCR